MPRHKNVGVDLHLHIDPHVWVKEEGSLEEVNGDARKSRFLQWYFSGKHKKRTAMAFELLLAAVNGELGVASSVLEREDVTEEDRERLKDLLSNMVLDEQDI